MVERADRAAVGTFYAPGAWSADEGITLPDGAAHHALVRRFGVGDVVRLTSGDGRRATARITQLGKGKLVVEMEAGTLENVTALPPIALWAPVGDRDRMLMLAEKAAELGVTSWHPVLYERSRSVSPRGEGSAFAEKVRARMVGALEQSGSAWLPETHREQSFDAALASHAEGGTRVLLDPDGELLGEIARQLDAPVSIALGPEGGLAETERDAFIRAGWRPVSLGTNVLRFETAGIAALAIVRTLSR